MEQIYREEQLKMVKLLNTNLDQLSLSGSGFTPTTQKKRYTERSSFSLLPLPPSSPSFFSLLLPPSPSFFLSGFPHFLLPSPLLPSFSSLPSLLPPPLPSNRNVMSETGNIALTKQDLQLKLQVNVTIHEVCHLPNMEGKPVFCVFEVTLVFVCLFVCLFGT